LINLLQATYRPISVQTSEWSFAQFRVRNATKYSVAFDQQHPNTITIVGIDKRCVEELESLSTLHCLNSSL
jgi:hypothetical protein